MTTSMTYIYETISQNDGEAVKHYEIKQSMADRALKRHAETGEPIRRVILRRLRCFEIPRYNRGPVIALRLRPGRLLRIKLGGSMKTETALWTCPLAPSRAQVGHNLQVEVPASTGVSYDYEQAIVTVFGLKTDRCRLRHDSCQPLPREEPDGTGGR